MTAGLVLLAITKPAIVTAQDMESVIMELVFVLMDILGLNVNLINVLIFAITTESVKKMESVHASKASKEKAATNLILFMD